MKSYAGPLELVRSKYVFKEGWHLQQRGTF